MISAVHLVTLARLTDISQSFLFWFPHGWLINGDSRSYQPTVSDTAQMSGLVYGER